MPEDIALESGIYSGSFLFEVDGVEIGRFREVDGLEIDVEVVTHEEGGMNGFVHQFPGRVRWPNIVLRGGLTRGDALFKWVNRSSGDGLDANSSTLERSTGAIVLLSRSGERMRSWSFAGAFPVRWSGPRFSMSSSQDLEEELEIAHHGFYVEDQ